jgi:hypothetical protein
LVHWVTNQAVIANSRMLRVNINKSKTKLLVSSLNTKHLGHKLIYQSSPRSWQIHVRFRPMMGRLRLIWNQFLKRLDLIWNQSRLRHRFQLMMLVSTLINLRMQMWSFLL